MGGGGSTIVNVEDVEEAINAGEITVKEACKYVKCPPNREKFNNEDDDNTEYWLAILIMLLIFFIFTMSLLLKKYI
jgi:hypothetical protein